MVMPARSSASPSRGAKSSAVKGMAVPTRPFLEKSSTVRTAGSRSQKKAEAGSVRERRRTPARNTRAAGRNVRFMEYLLFCVMYP